MADQKGTLSVKLHCSEVESTEINALPEVALFRHQETGLGTGLNLSVIHGIVKNYKGFIRLESAPEAEASSVAGSEGILVVDGEKPYLTPREADLFFLYNFAISGEYPPPFFA
jgi:hypothetical protein